MSEERYLDRGMTADEVKILLQAPMPDRERAFYRTIYETFYRANELLLCNIEDYHENTGELTALHTRGKFNPTPRRQHIENPPKHMLISPTTQLLFKNVIGNRKEGPIFISKRGNRISIICFQEFIHKLATEIGIQQVTNITKTGREYHLVTLKALREAGESHCNFDGMDKDVSAEAVAAQHSAIVNEKHYKEMYWIELQAQIKRYHPAFQE